MEYHGDKKPLVIRRCKCEACNKIHHELPDIVVPYKRYTADAIEKILASNAVLEEYGCETSTVLRIRTWFFMLVARFQKALESLMAFFAYDQEVRRTIRGIMPLQKHVGCSDGWLKILVRLLVNSNRWIQTRSA